MIRRMMIDPISKRRTANVTSAWRCIGGSNTQIFTTTKLQRGNEGEKQQIRTNSIFPNPLSTSGIGPVTLGGGNEDHSPVEHTPIYSTSKMLPMATAAVPLHTTINVQDIEMCNTWAVHVSQVDQRPPIPRHHSLTTVRQRSNQSMPYLPHAKSQGHIQQGIGEAVFNCLQSASFSVQPENQKLNQAGMGHQSAPLSLLEVSQLQYQKQQPSVVNSFGASRSRMTDKNVPDIWILQTEDKKRKPPANMKATFITFNYAKPVYNSLGVHQSGELVSTEGFSYKQFIKGEDSNNGACTRLSLLKLMQVWMDELTGFDLNYSNTAILKEHSRHEKGKAAEDNTSPLSTAWSQRNDMCNESVNETSRMFSAVSSQFSAVTQTLKAGIDNNAKELRQIHQAMQAQQGSAKKQGRSTATILHFVYLWIAPPPSDKENDNFECLASGRIWVTPQSFRIDLSQSRNPPFNHHCRLEMLQQSSHSTRKLYKARLKIITQQTNLNKHYDPVKCLGSQGVSSDESDPEHSEDKDGLEDSYNIFARKFVRIYPTWQNDQLAGFMWNLDTWVQHRCEPRIGHQTI
ncbi:hypothetical protein SERLADRAFT_404599 [Serpula lacrymans var. lacrymans S7.9]|uniref:Uncharacterized protein n=1 Tax=Serpula lacrymans var. lacrymans (strain S7.9) TaxID=578457 RepID=F8NDV4_SERL9|nr:uncharacterized protein SERLADRAFT_404599 [Serpula lacrymans var. lacrymans S7.9]EGO30428.1 hypothetical protein SERLADRAFT_404599 [Serpula lacrymans var. lacrymans S7.9]